MLLCLSSRTRPSRGGVQGAAGGAAVRSKSPWCGFEPAGGLSSQPLSDCSPETSLDPTLHTEPQSSPGALQEVCSYQIPLHRMI